ncbi:GSU2403 family nucleotidyltransferase fold protein [Methylobacterium sp. NFXW15]|uniref:GSU2403 family nucleotidyltransferase fold protein n=1 Tax=Methylobacterium sp. NFXW15 TaxID=2819512 RepID=UPI003CEDFC1E
MQTENLHTPKFAMVRPLSLAQHTLYADLTEQGSDAVFDPEFPENGSIIVRGNRPGAPALHAYYQGYRARAGAAGQGQRFARYLGRADDPAVAARIARFQRIKAVRAERATTVRALIGAGMPKPDRMAGRIVEALARAGLFSDHAVLIGDAAVQTYGGVLGVRLPKPRKTFQSDRPAVEIAIPDRSQRSSILDILHTIDPSFAIVTGVAKTYRSAEGSEVIVTSPDCADEATSAISGFLVTRAVQAIVLYGPGIPVSVPVPERYVAYAQIAYRTAISTGLHDLIDAFTLAGREGRLAEARAELRSLLR